MKGKETTSKSRTAAAGYTLGSKNLITMNHKMWLLSLPLE